MEIKEILDYCLSKPGAYIDHPFGEIPVCVKVKGRLFAQAYPKKEDLKLTLNCEAAAGEFFRAMYPGTVVKGYHCPPQLAPYFNTIYLNGAVPDAEAEDDDRPFVFYVVKKLPKKIQQEILAVSNNLTPKKIK